MADASQDESEVTFKFIEEFYNYKGVWGVSSVAYKDTKNKQKKMDEPGGQTGSCPNLSISSLLSVPSLLFFCFPVLRECHYTKSAMLQITVCCDLTRVWRVKERFCHVSCIEDTIY